MGIGAKPLPNIVCFTGENAFALREERRRWTEKFREKHGDHNLLTLASAALTVRTLLDEVGVSPFLAERRLVFVEGIPRFSREEMEIVLANTHDDVILVFLEALPDRRLGGVKILLQHATIHAFPSLHGSRLIEWIRSIPAASGMTIETDAIQALMECVGDDQEVLFHELKKLCLYADGTIGRPHVETLAVVNAAEGLIWHLGELIGGRDVHKALLYIHELLRRGEDPFRLWNILLWMLRCLLQIAMFRTEGMEEHAILQAIALRPHMARACVAATRSMKISRIQEVLDHVLEVDRRIKTGEYRASAAEPGELLALVDQLVLHLAEASIG